jgi:putative FmdB family regulatory protein
MGLKLRNNMIYDRQCNSCDELFEVNCKMSEKDNDHECPYCGSVEGEWRPSAPAFTMRGDRLMTRKKDAGFKEVLQKIASRNKRTPMTQQV